MSYTVWTGKGSNVIPPSTWYSNCYVIWDGYVKEMDLPTTNALTAYAWGGSYHLYDRSKMTSNMRVGYTIGDPSV